MNRIFTAVFMVVLCCLPGAVCLGDNLITNGGFETPEGIASATTLPDTCAQWEGDEAAITTAQQGISPQEGSHMLQFVYTYTYPSFGNVACEVWQIIDVTSLSTVISGGDAVAEVSYQVNRVDVDEETDTSFNLVVRAYASACSSFPAAFNNPLATISSTVYSDSDVGTWELVSAQLLLPTNTTLVAIRVSTHENIFNDSTDPEFDGHYGDNVVFEIVQPCLGEPDGTPCVDDDNECTDDECLAGSCAHPVSADGTPCTDDDNECTDDECLAGSCTHFAIADGTPCTDDDNECTDDECFAGTCDHPLISCDDSNDCTADWCVPSYGCTNSNFEVRGLVWPDHTTILWNPVAPDALYDVVRGDLAHLPVSGGPTEQCLASGVSDPTTEDVEELDPGQKLWYLVRGYNLSCGIGTYGYQFRDSQLWPERSTMACP